MIDSHIYQRMSKPLIMKGYLRMINDEDFETATALYNNITREADDHPNYAIIHETYMSRKNANTQE